VLAGQNTPIAQALAEQPALAFKHGASKFSITAALLYRNPPLAESTMRPVPPGLHGPALRSPPNPLDTEQEIRGLLPKASEDFDHVIKMNHGTLLTTASSVI
jgi:hypothetical protein